MPGSTSEANSEAVWFGVKQIYESATLHELPSTKNKCTYALRVMFVFVIEIRVFCVAAFDALDE